MTNQPIVNLMIKHLNPDSTTLVQSTDDPTTILNQALQLEPEKREALVVDMIAHLDQAMMQDETDDETFQEIDYAVETDEMMAVQQALDWADVISLGYLAVPPLTPDEDVERLLARQKEMMETVFEGIGEEKKATKRAGLAFQQLQIEQQHALRLLLCYPDLSALLSHLKQCLEDPEYGYGSRGNNGRTIAQALSSLAEAETVSFEKAVEFWWEDGAIFREQILSGTAMSMRPRFDDTTLTTFQPVLRRVSEQTWRLGVVDQGQYRDFTGSLLDIWDTIADTFVVWSDLDNEQWLTDLKRQAAKMPDSLERVVWAERLRKEICDITVEGHEIQLNITRIPTDEAWPRSIVFGTEVGLTRLSGHGFYELAWERGEQVRRFDLSNTTRNKVPFEHPEIAVVLAHVLAGLDNSGSDPISPTEIEAAYLRRMKVNKAYLNAPETDLPVTNLKGQPLVSYWVGDVTATWLQGSDILVCAVKGDKVVVLQVDEKLGFLFARPVVRGRVRRQNLMSIPMTEIGEGGEWMRALLAWACWLVWV